MRLKERWHITMFKKVKASPATRKASATEGSASEKKRKKMNVNVKKICCVSGYAAAVLFIAIAAKQATGAIANVNAASIVYDNQMAKLLEEKRKAEQAVAEKLNVSIDDDGNIESNTKDIFNENKNDDQFEYSRDEDGNVICIDKNGNETTYYICTTCSKCGHITNDNMICAKCGSDLCRYTVYQVEKGDTLSEVSGKVGASVNSIAHLNEIDNVNLIYEGESLRIPE